ncbi:MAG TPA: hypothetical protein RMH99_32310 [Sandaracinaceae bacterium LLY-WYZ-13_1]|nr:hypothetical protein [Sandaracinaceae bacterium LLY-WYZ-13_1]
MGKDKMGWGAAGCGLLLVLLCFAGFLFWGFHTWVEPGGAISADEAFPGVLGSCCCGIVSLAIAGAGVFVAMKAKKDAAPPSA